MSMQNAGETGKQKQMNKTRLTKTGFDFGFLFAVVILLTLGLLMVFSASYPYAYYKFSDGLYFIKRQLLWAGLGAVAMAFTANFPYHKYKKYAFPILATSAVLLLAVLVIGIEWNGAKRWLGFGSMTFQPSEVAKLALIIYFAASLAQAKSKITEFKYLVRYWLILGVFLGLLLLEPHFSVCLIIGFTMVIMLLVAGAKFRYFAMLAVPVIPAGVAIAILEPYRLKRLPNCYRTWKS